MAEKIYKYVDLKSGLLILKNNSVKVSHPMDYNDPFDCSIDYDKSDITESLTLITEYYMAQEFLRLWSNEDLKVNKAARLTMNNDKFLLNAGNYSEETYNALESEFKDETINKVIDIKDNSLLSCFSKTYDKI